MKFLLHCIRTIRSRIPVAAIGSCDSFLRAFGEDWSPASGRPSDLNRCERCRVESAKACAIPDLLCSLRTFGISYSFGYIRGKSPLSPLISISSLSCCPSSSPQCERHRPRGYIPIAERDWTFRKET